MKKNQKLKNWELALLAALCITLTAGMLADRDQRALSGALVRLHVIANSDSGTDQAEKLQMRDRVLALLSPLLAGCRSQEEAADVILSHAAELEALGDVTVALDREYYPTRQYSTFSLPAGEYLSLRITMGEGAGKNWWCVIYPPLCTEALAEPDRDAFLSLQGDEAALITRSETGYELRFRIVEWWGELRALLDGQQPGT